MHSEDTESTLDPVFVPLYDSTQDYSLGTYGCSWKKRPKYDDQNTRVVFVEPEERRELRFD